MQLQGKTAMVTGSSRNLGKAIAEQLTALGATIVPYPALSMDILVNNAAIQGPVGPVEDTARRQWEEPLNANLLMPIYLTKSVIHLMKAARWGKIINISGGGAVSPRPNYAIYATSKAALVGFSMTLAAELEPWHIDVNCVAPGDLGPMGADRGEPNEATLKAARLVAMLASPETDGITGRLFAAQWDDWEYALSKGKSAVIQDKRMFTMQRMEWEE